MMKYTFAIPTFKDFNLTNKCIASIRKFHPKFEIIVMDDASPSSYIYELKKIEGIKLLTSFHNSGFGCTSNRGIEQASGDVVILLNNDIELTMPVLEAYEKIFESDPKIGVIGNLLYYPNGLVQFGGHVFISPGQDLLHYDHGVHPSKATMAFKDRYAISTTGAMMAIKKSMVDHIGGFKKDYWLAYEDNEFCFKAWHTGYRVFYTSKISAIHAEGAVRGKTAGEKMQKGTWQKELDTKKQYQKDIAIYDFTELKRLVNKANGLDMPNRPERIGIIRKGALGDCVMTTGVIDELKKRNPNSDIYVCTLSDYPYQANKSVTRLFRNAETMLEQVDYVYVLDMVYENNPKRPVWLAYADHVFGEGEYQPEDVKPRLTSFLQARQGLQKILGASFKNEKPTCVIHASCGFWSSKHWGKHNYEELNKQLQDRGYETVLVGSGSDYNIEGVNYNLKDKLDLPLVYELIKMCDLYIGMDGGISHIALCTQTPCILMFTAADPKCFVHRWKDTIVVDPNSECKFCRNQVSGSTGFPCWHGDNHCVKSIEVKDLMVAVGFMENNNK